MIVLGLLAVPIWWYYDHESKRVYIDPTQPIITDPAKYAAQNTPKELPVTGDFYKMNAPSTGGFIDVKVKYTENVLVKIDRLGGAEAARGFIRAGESLRFELPAGVYTIKSASGQVWYGPEMLFGRKTRYARADDTFSLEKPGDAWSVELIPQEKGNLREVEIGRGDF